MVKRNTLQKNIILEAVKRLRNHPSGDDVYEEISDDYPSISRATVFRNLNSLSESGEIAKRTMTEGPDRFDHNVSNHYHLRCEECGGVFDIELSYMANLNKKAKATGDFEIHRHDLVFSGLCSSCNNLVERS